MNRIIKDFEIRIEINEDILCKIKSEITQESLIKCAKGIKDKLLTKEIAKEKVHDVFEISIEVLQNILKYSYGNKKCENNKLEANGLFFVTYNTLTKIITIKSCCYIKSTQVDIIKQRVAEVSQLDENSLRKLFRDKLKSKRDNHKNGAGLGFLTIASKIKEPIKINFGDISEDIKKYSLEIII